MKKRRLRCGLTILSVAVMALSVLGGVVVNVLPAKASANATVHNPRIVNGVTTWDKIQFGSYYQDAEPIKWRILDIDNEGNAFLLADEALDAKPYNITSHSCGDRGRFSVSFFD